MVGISVGHIQVHVHNFIIREYVQFLLYFCIKITYWKTSLKWIYHMNLGTNTAIHLEKLRTIWTIILKIMIEQFSQCIITCTYCTTQTDYKSDIGTWNKNNPPFCWACFYWSMKKKTTMSSTYKKTTMLMLALIEHVDGKDGYISATVLHKKIIIIWSRENVFHTILTRLRTVLCYCLYADMIETKL